MDYDLVMAPSTKNLKKVLDPSDNVLPSSQIQRMAFKLRVPVQVITTLPRSTPITDTKQRDTDALNEMLLHFVRGEFTQGIAWRIGDGHGQNAECVELQDERSHQRT